MASTYLTRTVSSSGSDTKGTISFWVKRGNLGSNQVIVGGKKANTERVTIGFSTENYFEIQFQDTNNAYYWKSSAVYRDTFAWYNCVIQLDTSNVTATSRARAWINNEEITSWSLKETVPQNLSIGFSSNSNVPHVGARGGSSVDKYFDGLVSHLHFIDGTAYDATAFGETDATTGEWKAKTSPSVTYGTNGFFILKDGNGITDQSGEGNDFTLGGGTLTDLKDNPDNVFATLNPLDNFYGSATFSNGNNTIVTGYSSFAANTSTLGMVSGKWYCEIKAVNIYNGYAQFGIKGRVSTATNDKGGTGTDGYVYTASGGNKINNNTATSYGTVWNNNDIIGIAVDLDNNYLYFSRNGTWQNSGDPTSGSSGTGAAFSLGTPSSGAYYFCTSDNDSGATNTYQANFGNGYFGTTAVSSAGTNASEIGIFEYDVPTGYTALSTKGLNL